MDVKSVLAAAGLDLGWLVDVGAKHGETVFGVVESLLNHGFSTAWVVQTVDRVHPLVMDVLYQVFAIPAGAGAAALGAADGVAGVAPGLVDGLIKSGMAAYFVQKLMELLPSLGLTGFKLLAAQSGLQILLGILTKKAA